MAIGRMMLKKKLPMKYHSPAGRRYLKRKKKSEGTKTVYYKTVKGKSTAQRLKEAGLTKDDLRSLGIR